MKKFIFIVVFPLFINSINAQVSVGIRSGLNISNQSQNFYEETYGVKSLYSTDFSFSLPLRFQLSDRWFFQPELAFIRRSGRLEGHSPQLFPYSTLTLKTSVVELPLLFGYDLIKKDRFKLGLYGGLSIGQTLHTTYGWDDSEIDISIDEFPTFSSLEYNFVLGMDMQFKLGKHQFVFDARYSYEVWGSDLYTNHEFNLSLGYIIPLK